MRRLKQALFLPEPKNYPNVDTLQDLKVPKCLLQEMLLLIISEVLQFRGFLITKLWFYKIQTLNSLSGINVSTDFTR